MKTLKFNSKEEWLEARKTKITGSRLGDIVTKRGTGKKLGYYELIAERLAVSPDGENPMDRGNRLEEEAIEIFKEETKKDVDTSLVLWQREDNESIAISPDGVIGEAEAVEVKCLGSAKHIEAFLKQEIPSDYEFQVLQYFIVNDKLEKLYFCFYDPRLTTKQFFFITINREEKAEDIKTYLEYQNKVLEEVKEIVLKLSF